MRRTWILGAALGCGLVAVAIALAPMRSTGALQGQEPNPPAKAAESPLPIKHVVLFNSGVGYMQREGVVEGDAKVDLAFPASDINDLLKSLILQDLGGGKVGVVSYDSHDPADKVLRSFSIDLNDNPTFAQILNQARGEKIELTLLPKKEGPTTKLTGTIVGLEAKKRLVGKDQTIDDEILNLTGPQGLQAVSLGDVQGAKFLNARLDEEFRRALQVLASTHDLQKKSVNLAFAGAGKRSVRVGYVVERPIWKTTYRLRIDPNGKLVMQGWALVENTSDDDWNDVRMVLVSGRPISFRMNLYEPLFMPRPLVEPEMFASLRPPVYQGGFPAAQGGLADMPAQNANQGGMAGFPGGQAGQFGQFGGQFGGNANPFGNAAQFREQQRLQREVLDANSKLTYEELMKRKAAQKEAREEAKAVGPAVAMNFKEGIDSVATGEEAGDFYQYVLDQKISLARQKSAMLPILDHTVEGAKVSIFNEAVHAKHPLLGLRIKNTSGQPFTQGPITVYDGGNYAGDSRILDVQPGESRMISYALDQGTEIKIATKETVSPDMKLRLGEAKLSANYRVRQTKTYTIRNRSPHDRVVILEHPIRAGWSLVDPKKATDQSARLYRFQVAAPSGKTTTFDVVEEEPRHDLHDYPAGQPQQLANAGITLKSVVHPEAEKLIGGTIAAGVFLPKYTIRASTTYFVQNLTDLERSFDVDHIVPKQWTRIEDKGAGQEGPAVYHFALTAGKDQTAQKEIVEEKTWVTEGMLVKAMPEKYVRECVANPKLSADVKNALSKALEWNRKVLGAQTAAAALQTKLRIASDDQSRLRANLQVIPMSSEHYKKFLEKFVDQEAEIESLQRQARQAQTTLDSVQQERDLFFADLKAN